MGQRPEFARIRALLEKSLHFRELRAAELDEIAGLGRLRRLRDAEVAGAAGRSHDELWIVLHGGLRLSTVTAAGDEFVYAVLGPGSFYGLAHVVSSSRNAIVETRAFGPTELAIIEGEPFLAMLDANPRLWRHFAGLLVRRLSLAMSVIRDFSVAPLDQRIARRLLGQAMGGGADIDGAPVEMRVNQADLSRMLGASRSRVNAELKRMESEGLLKVGYRTVTLVDLARLREIAGPEVFAF